MATEVKAESKQQVVPGPRKKPPKLLMKLIMNPMMKWMLRPGSKSKAGQMLLLLTFTGKKSGKQFTAPVGYHRMGEYIELHTHSPWWRNFVGGATVKVVVAGKVLTGWAEDISDPEAVQQDVTEYIRIYGLDKVGQLGIVLPTDHQPSAEELAQATRGLHVIRIKAQGE